MTKHSMMEIFAAKRTLVSKEMSIHDLTRMPNHFHDRIGCPSFGGPDGIGIYARKTEWEKKETVTASRARTRTRSPGARLCLHAMYAIRVFPSCSKANARSKWRETVSLLFGNATASLIPRQFDQEHHCFSQTPRFL